MKISIKIQRKKKRVRNRAVDRWVVGDDVFTTFLRRFYDVFTTFLRRNWLGLGLHRTRIDFYFIRFDLI